MQRAGDLKQTEMVFVYHRPNSECVGAFSLSRHRHFGFFSKLSLRHNSFSSLATPLLHQDHGEAVIQAFCEWLKKGAHTSLFEVAMVSTDGVFSMLLANTLQANGIQWEICSTFTRGIFFPDPLGMEEYLGKASIKTSYLQKLRAKERQLSVKGKVELLRLKDEENSEEWFDDFLKLERKGWKGREGTAMDCQVRERLFFKTIAREALKRGKLNMIALCFDGKPIAMSFNLVSSRCGFIFKITYDEEFAKYAPGIQLQIQNMRTIHLHQELIWLDSCAQPQDEVYKDLWGGRLSVSSLRIFSPTLLGTFEQVRIRVRRRMKAFYDVLRLNYFQKPI